MPGYLDQYGAGEEQRIKFIWRAVTVIIIAVICAGVLYFFLKNYREEREARTFLQLLRNRDYQAAYRLWGCSPKKPDVCRDYPFNKFMEDWGPNSPHADVSAARVSKSRSCGSGVILTVSLGHDQQEKLWVQRDDLTLGFSPWPGCPPGR